MEKEESEGENRHHYFNNTHILYFSLGIPVVHMGNIYVEPHLSVIRDHPDVVGAFRGSSAHAFISEL